MLTTLVGTSVLDMCMVTHPLGKGIALPWPRLNWPFEMFQLSPRRRRPELQPSPSRGQDPLHSPTPSSEEPQRTPPTPKEKKKLPAPPRERDGTIHQLMRNPTLRDPLRAPRYPIVLCHGKRRSHCLLEQRVDVVQGCTDLMSVDRARYRLSACITGQMYGISCVRLSARTSSSALYLGEYLREGVFYFFRLIFFTQR